MASLPIWNMLPRMSLIIYWTPVPNALWVLAYGHTLSGYSNKTSRTRIVIFRNKFHLISQYMLNFANFCKIEYYKWQL